MTLLSTHTENQNKIGKINWKKNCKIWIYSFYLLLSSSLHKYVLNWDFTFPLEWFTPGGFNCLTIESRHVLKSMSWQGYNIFESRTPALISPNTSKCRPIQSIISRSRCSRLANLSGEFVWLLALVTKWCNAVLSS